VPVRAIFKDFLANKLTPQNRTFGRTGWTKSAAFARKCKKVFFLTRGTPNSGKTILQHPAIQVPGYHRADHGPPFAVVSFKSMIVLTHEPIEMMKEH
jgi:hypothetical protein